ncbi:glycosyltransferase [Methylosinus sp. R-45379]|jgi:glycosyltransferase involved in cell wall biosynthesis|uniref:glycosyltransferase n=1 Tax=Methylosinus sp. R-45379 TaxID=980563 RepID=UPI0009FDB7FD|nr:glycosyltransferase [Methylosinus sp. R-45379]
MKILHVILTLSPKYGGPVTMLKDISLAMKDRGHEITVVATNFSYPHGRSNEHPYESFPEVDVRLFPFWSENYALSPQFARFIWRRVHEFDLVHIHGLYRFPLSLAAFVCGLKKVPYIISIHGALDPFLYNRTRNWLLKRLYEKLVDFPLLRRAARIHYATNEEWALVRQLKLGDKGAVIPNGVDVSRFLPTPQLGSFRAKHAISEANLLLFVGRINFKKGLDITLKSLPKVIQSHPSTKLVIAGPDNEGYKKDLEIIIQEQGIQRNVAFIGMQTAEQMAEAFADATLFLLPSYTENFGIAVVEAMLCGCPVVISNRVNIHSDLSAHDAALVVDCDTEDIAEKVVLALGSPQLRTKLSQNGRNVSHELYSIETVTAQFEDLYHQVAGEIRVGP